MDSMKPTTHTPLSRPERAYRKGRTPPQAKEGVREGAG